MCGIFAHLSDKKINSDKHVFNFYLTKHRGPDNSRFQKINEQITFGFHRLSINDLTGTGNQPFSFNGLHLICNGEIYNHRELQQKNSFEHKTNSDCEIIMSMYSKFGIRETLRQLDGVFAFILYDSNKDILFAARDPIGVRPLFIGSVDDEIMFASEVKSIDHHCTEVDQFKPGHYWNSIDREFVSYWNFPDHIIMPPNSDCCINKNRLKSINSLLKKAITKRIENSEREIGLFLSGGFDSSIVAAIAQKESKTQLQTFSIGFQDSSDLKYAQKVADKIKSNHHEVNYTLEEALSIIPEVIKSLETYDVTTVRASVPMWVLSKYIAKETNVKVVLSGEGADEYGSYLYFKDAPSPAAFRQESYRLFRELHKYDVLRTDRSTTAHGLEVRVPFLDKDFLEFFTQIDIKYRMPYEKIEKYHLRKSFEDDDLLPTEVLWRPKDAFSDSVGHSWKSYITDHVNTLYTDEQFEKARSEIKHLPPLTKEGLWYRHIFENHFTPKAVTLLDAYWMPKWQADTVVDPSATVL